MQLTMAEIIVIIDTLQASLTIEDTYNRIFRSDRTARLQVLNHFYTQLNNIEIKVKTDFIIEEKPKG